MKTFKIYQEQSLLAEPVMFEDIKGWSMSPMHMRMRLVEMTDLV